MRFDIITLFPDMLRPVLQTSILKRAQAKGAVDYSLHDLRQGADDKYQTVDDTPYGGGAGMVLKVDVADRVLGQVAAQEAVAGVAPEKRCIILLTPQGKQYRQADARELAGNFDQITLFCGHYEGYDERIRSLVDRQYSVGPYVLTGGEVPALLIVDSITRLLPEVIASDSPEEESFSLTDERGKPLLEYPHYTRPQEYLGQTVPEILLSGNHAAIRKWRLEAAKQRTEQAERRNDEQNL